MKKLIVLLILGLVGCATSRTQSTMSYDEVKNYQVTNADCPRMDYIINNMEYQLRARGLANKEPEQLNDNDRQYNAYARIVIWSLRIGCNNPDRYK